VATVREVMKTTLYSVDPSTTVGEAISLMARNRIGSALIMEGGRLIGIFTERDVMTRVVRRQLDPERTRLADVMTPDPEVLAPQDRICYAINRMHSAGYRSVPLVDADRRPMGIVTVIDVVKWLAEIFPEAVLNLRPGDRIKRPLQIDAG